MHPFFDTSSTHGDDVLYVFDFPGTEPLFQDKEKQFSEYLTKLWATFAKTGSVTSIIPQWTPVEKGKEPNYYSLSSERSGSMIGPFRLNAMKFWRNIS